MGEVVRFLPKSELERARLIREARATYESIFPTLKGPSSQNAGSEVTAASPKIIYGSLSRRRPASSGHEPNVSMDHEPT